MKKVIRLAAVAFTIAALTVGPAAVASAETPSLPPEVEDGLINSMLELGVDPGKWDSLLEKFANGEGFDSDPSSGVDAILVDEYRAGDMDHTRSVYPDGSVTLGSVERPIEGDSGSGLVGPMYISGCTYHYSAGVASWTDCRIGHQNISYHLWFTASYWRGAGGSGVSGVHPHNWHISSSIDSCTMDFLGNTSPTSARLRAHCTYYAGGTFYPWVDLAVTPSSAAQTSNF